MGRKFSTAEYLQKEYLMDEKGRVKGSLGMYKDQELKRTQMKEAYRRKRLKRLIGGYLRGRYIAFCITRYHEFTILVRKSRLLVGLPPRVYTVRNGKVVSYSK